MKEDKFKEKAKKVGQKQAEKELDERIKADIDYMKEKNQLGSEKIPIIEIGEHSAYISKYTYNTTYDGQCTNQTADPVNLFFYDTGYQSKVVANLNNAGWSYTSWGDIQCAYVSSTQPFDGIHGLQKQSNQVEKGYGWLTGSLLERDHMRIWDAGFSGDSIGWWSIGAAHHEEVSVSERDHCLTPYDPNGSSFDLAEYHVWYEALGYYPHYFPDLQNAGTTISCGNNVWHDQYAAGVDIPSNMLSPGEGLAPGQHRYSQDLRFLFVYQTNGNLVLYQGGIDSNGTYNGVPIWASNTLIAPGYAIMQSDGNFVLYDSAGHPYWATNTYGNPGAWLIVQNDGNVVIYRSNGTPMWWTGTCCR